MHCHRQAPSATGEDMMAARYAHIGPTSSGETPEHVLGAMRAAQWGVHMCYRKCNDHSTTTRGTFFLQWDA